MNCLFVRETILEGILVNELALRGIVPTLMSPAQAGRLQYHMKSWNALTRDRWVLDAVRGYRIDFVSQPHQASPPAPIRFNQVQEELVAKELDELLQKGAVEKTEAHPEGFYSILFPVPKKDGGQRLVINLKALNTFVQPAHFKMEGIHTLKEIVKPGDWLAKIDLKDAYFAIPIHPDHRCYLRFASKGSTYQFTCLPFGLSSAPWVFTKTLKPAIALLRELGVRIIVYIDDMLLLAETRSSLRNHIAGTRYILECLGFTVNQDKSIMEPTQEIEFLGITINTKQMIMCLPTEKLKKIQADARNLLGEAVTSARKLARLIGKMNASARVIPPAPLFYRNLQRDLSQVLETGGSELRHTPFNLARWVRGTGVVGHANEKLEWQNHPEEGGRYCHRIRCIPGGLGSVMYATADRRSVVSPGEGNAHKLPGTISGHPSSPVLPEGQIGSPRAAEAGQHNSSSLYKPPGWHSIQDSGNADQEFVDVVPGKEYLHCSGTCPGSLQSNCRQGVSNHQGQVRLDARPKSLPQDRPTLRPDPNRPVCIETHYSVPPLFQLAARSFCTSHRCLFTGLDNVEGFSQPTVVPDWPNPGPHQITTSQGSTPGPSMDEPAMVPNPIGDAIRLPNTTPGGSTGPNPGHRHANLSSTSRMAYLRTRFRCQELSEEATSLILSSWRVKTNKSYDSLFGKWHSWCSGRSSDPISGPVTKEANFLADLYKRGYKYNSINAYRSAISSVHNKVDGQEIGQHPTISRLMKGIYNNRPPLPRYTCTWDVRIVLDFIKALGDNQSLSLKSLTLKTVMLMALTRPSRSADLSQLDINAKRYKPDGVVFTPKALSKQSQSGRAITEFFFPSFPDDSSLCPVLALRAYEESTRQLREGTSQLFVAIIKPHKAVSSSTIARWLKTMIGMAGINTSIFKTHSTRGASASTAASMGVTTNEILKAADWSSESVFQKFYYKPTESSSYGRAVLSAGGQPE